MTATAQQADAIDYVIRPARMVDSDHGESELRWVQSVWSRCAKLEPRKPYAMVAVGAPNTSVWIDAKLVYRMHHRIVDELLPKSAVLVAALRRMPDAAIGFAVFEGPMLHYVYVAPDSRRAGIGRQLALHTRCSTASHVTQDGARLLRCLSGYAS